MINTVNSVLVGKVQKTSYTGVTTQQDLAAGDIFVENQDGKLLTSTTMTGVKAIKVGLVTPEVIQYTKPDGTTASLKKIVYSDYIKKADVESYRPFDFVAVKEDVVTITATDANFTPVIGYRYVLRLIYKDLYEHPGQYTHTYEIIAKTASLSDLFDGFVKLINKDTRRRCAAVKSTGTGTTIITLTALPKTDNVGKESINEYTQVNMTAVMYYTNPSAVGFASKNKYPLAGVDIAKIPGTPGKGNAKIIRDREKFALSYRGITNRTWFPVIKPELLVDLSKNYNGCVLEFNNEYKNAEDRFAKAKQAIELYTETNATDTFETSMPGKIIKAFVG